MDELRVCPYCGSNTSWNRRAPPIDASRAEDARDAARYRWIHRQPLGFGSRFCGPELDKCIDHEIAQDAARALATDGAKDGTGDQQ